MEKNSIDASIGLSFSLGLLKRYRQNGMLCAELPRAPGVRGRCTASLQLVNGEVVSVFLQDKQGQRYSSDKETLCRFDKEKGPFEWTLLPSSIPPAESKPNKEARPTSPAPAVHSLECSFVPKIIAILTWDWLSTQPPERRDAFYTVLTIINGERTIADIKDMVPFSPDMVDDLLRTLLALNVIIISAK